MAPPTITMYICLSIGSVLFLGNLLVFYAVVTKKQHSTVDYLIGAMCLHGQLYYILTSVVILASIFAIGNHATALTCFRDWLACYFGFAFVMLSAMFFADRYLATSRPLFFKIKVTNQFAHLGIVFNIFVSLLLSSLVVAQHYWRVFANAYYSFFICLNALVMSCFIVMLFCYVAICKALLYFAGRQMYIFNVAGNTHRTSTDSHIATTLSLENPHINTSSSSLDTTPSSTLERPRNTVETLSSLSTHHFQAKLKTLQLLKISSLKETERQRPVDRKPVKKFSLPATSSANRIMRTASCGVRSDRFSCPNNLISADGPPDLPLWLIATLSEDILSQNKGKKTCGIIGAKQRFPLERRSAMYNPSTSGDGRRVGRRERGYTILNVVSDLIASRRNESDKELRLSHARNLVQILTTTLALYLFWCPFIVSLID